MNWLFKNWFDGIVIKSLIYVYRMLNDYDRAADLAQETFVRVYTNAERYQATYSFSTYIYRIAHNLAISELRQRKRRRLIPFPSFFSDKDSEEVEVEIEDKRQVMADDSMIADERRDGRPKGNRQFAGKIPSGIGSLRY